MRIKKKKDEVKEGVQEWLKIQPKFYSNGSEGL
jgi:hypothetical protein